MDGFISVVRNYIVESETGTRIFVLCLYSYICKVNSSDMYTSYRLIIMTLSIHFYYSCIFIVVFMHCLNSINLFNSIQLKWPIGTADLRHCIFSTMVTGHGGGSLGGRGQGFVTGLTSSYGSI